MAWLPLSSGFQSTPERAQAARHQAERGLEHEEPQHAGDRRRHRIGPDQQRLVDAGALDRACRPAPPAAARSTATAPSTAMEKIAVVRHGAVVVALREQIAIVLEPDEIGLQPEGVLQQERLPHRLARRPVEEDERDQRAAAPAADRAASCRRRSRAFPCMPRVAPLPRISAGEGRGEGQQQSLASESCRCPSP